MFQPFNYQLTEPKGRFSGSFGVRLSSLCPLFTNHLLTRDRDLGRYVGRENVVSDVVITRVDLESVVLLQVFQGRRIDALDRIALERAAADRVPDGRGAFLRQVTRRKCRSKIYREGKAMGDSLPGYYNLWDPGKKEDLSLPEHGVLIPLR